jgi:Holliday junction resolvasome RuvABC endonuclease subunit
MSQLLYGFDTSLTHFGYAVAWRVGPTHPLNWAAVGCIAPKTLNPAQRKKRDLSKTDDTRRRVEAIAVELRHLVARHGAPDVVAVESLVLGMKSTRATISALGRVRGLVDALCAEHGLSAQEFSPQALKKAVTGTNDADKADVSRCLVVDHPGLEALFDQLDLSSVEHAADACAAIHAFTTRSTHEES